VSRYLAANEVIEINAEVMRTHSLGCGSKDDAAEEHMAFFGALEVDGAGQFFVAIEGAAGNAGDFFIVDDGLPVLDDGDHAADERDVEGLPFAGLARKFRCRREEAVYASGVVARWLGNGIGLDLDFVAATQIDAAIGFRAAVELDVQLEIFKFGIVDQFGAVARSD
jgi:hypothetical protein